MRISIREKGKLRFFLVFPSRLIFNRFSSTLAAGIINKKLEKNDGVKIPASSLCRLSRSIMKYKKQNPGWKLVQVENPDSTSVIIKL